MRNWTYCDKTERNDLSLSCYVRIIAEPPKNRKGSFNGNFNIGSKPAPNLQLSRNGNYSVGIIIQHQAIYFALLDYIIDYTCR